MRGVNAKDSVCAFQIAEDTSGFDETSDSC